MVTAGVTQHAWAQGGVIRPRRLVRLFDFQESGNFESLPQNWFITGRPAETSDNSFYREPLHHDLMERSGYPSFTQVRFDDRHSVVGGRSFYMGLNGGNAGAFLEVGAIPAVPQSDYLVTAQVRTESLAKSSAYLTAYFIDQRGQRIEASIVTTRPIKTRGQWTQVAVKLQGDVKGAIWIGLEIDIRQPKRRTNDPLGQHRVVLQDVRGSAWFDQITIWQLPRIEIASQSKVNIVRAPDRPEFNVTVRDLTGQSLIVELTAYDHALRPAAHLRQVLGVGAPRDWTWEPKLPGYGWYLIDMRVRDKNPTADSAHAPVARTFGAVLWLPPAGSLHGLDAHRFELIGTDMSPKQFALLPDLLEATGIRATLLSIWEHQSTLADIESRKSRLDQIMQWLYLSGRTAGLSLNPVPDELSQAMRSPAANPITVLGGDQGQWLAYLSPTLLSHGQRVRRWHLGAPDQAYAFYNPDLDEVMSQVQQRFAALAPQPELVIPWRIDQARRHDLSSSLHYLIDVPPGVTPQQLPAYLEEWNDIKQNYTLHLREPPADVMSHPRRVTDLAVRMLAAWELDPAVISVSKLWTRAAQRETALVPDPLLGVFANLAHQLAGRRVIGHLNLGYGLQIRVLNGPAGAALVAWADRVDGEDAVLNIYMGPSPVVSDVWGNRQAVPLVRGKHRLKLTQTPVFITGIDPQLAMFRAGFQIDQPFIESTQTLHERQITLVNPWPTTISGHMQITGPKGWSAKPSRHFFSIASGRSAVLPVALSFPVSEVAGPTRLTARFQFTADQPMVIDMALPIEVGLADVKLNATVALVPGDKPGEEDATAAAVVTNTGNEMLSLYVVVILRGHPIQERIISDLEPGQTAVRRFRFSGAGQALRTGAMRVGIREVNGPRILNQRLIIDDTAR